MLASATQSFNSTIAQYVQNILDLNIVISIKPHTLIKEKESFDCFCSLSNVNLVSLTLATAHLVSPAATI